MSKQIIPKKIHYIWFGGNPKSDLILRCIESWHRFLPNYEIIEWNESNYDVTKCDYMRQAYEARRWAFASDYARFDILYEHGGIYLDTDVEFLKPLPEELLQHRAFTGFESSGNLAPGLIYASVPGFDLNREILRAYHNMKDVPGGMPACKTVNAVVKDVLQKHGVLLRNKFQVMDGLAIYPSIFFCGYDLNVGEYDIRPETISVHHYAGTWYGSPVKFRIRSLLKKVFGVSGYRKLLSVKRLLFGITGDKTCSK